MSSGGPRPNSGPARLPVEVKKALGTYRPSRDGQAAGIGIRLPRVPVPDPPEELREIEARWWRKIGAAVDAVGIYTAQDETGFRLLVRSQALLEDSHNKDARVSDIVALTRTVAGLLTQFGLTPSSRDKLRPPAAEASGEADPDDFAPLRSVPQ